MTVKIVPGRDIYSHMPANIYIHTTFSPFTTSTITTTFAQTYPACATSLNVTNPIDGNA